MEATLLRPLTRTLPDGTLYTRRLEVEVQIRELLQLSREEQDERMAIVDSGHRDFVRPECLMYFLRETRRDNHPGRFRTLYRLLMARFGKHFRRSEVVTASQTVVDAALAEVRDRATDRLMEKILQDKQSGDDRLDIYEVVFAMAAKRDRQSAERAVGRRAHREESLAGDEDREFAPQVEKALFEAAMALLTTNSDACDDRGKVLAAIDALPDKYRQVATMMMNNIQAEASGPDAVSISQVQNCTPKTARARGIEAARRIRLALGLEEGA